MTVPQTNHVTGALTGLAGTCDLLSSSCPRRDNKVSDTDFQGHSFQPGAWLISLKYKEDIIATMFKTVNGFLTSLSWEANMPIF